MVFKFVALSTLFALANAGFLHETHYASPVAPLAYAAPVAKIATPVAAAPLLAKVATPVLAKKIEDDFDPHPQYSYTYDVQDSLTGDNKQHSETRNGDSVQGSYSFIEADGSRRIVEYSADSLNGYNAVVHNVPASAPLAVEPAAKVVAAPLIAKAPLSYAAAPVLKTAPLVHAAPAVSIAYGAPFTKTLSYVQH